MAVEMAEMDDRYVIWQRYKEYVRAKRPDDISAKERSNLISACRQAGGYSEINQIRLINDPANSPMFLAFLARRIGIDQIYFNFELPSLLTIGATSENAFAFLSGDSEPIFTLPPNFPVTIEGIQWVLKAALSPYCITRLTAKDFGPSVTRPLLAS